MKRIVLVILLITIVVAGVWGYRKARDTFLRPVELVESDLPAYYAVFGVEINPGQDQSAARKERESLAKALQEAGITAEPGVVTWVAFKDGKMLMRMGSLVSAREFPKARALRGPFRAVPNPARRGWVNAAPGQVAGVVGAVMMPRFTSAAMEKARSLNLNSYWMVLHMDGGPARSALVPAPR